MFTSTTIIIWSLINNTLAVVPTSNIMNIVSTWLQITSVLRLNDRLPRPLRPSQWMTAWFLCCRWLESVPHLDFDQCPQNDKKQCFFLFFFPVFEVSCLHHCARWVAQTRLGGKKTKLTGSCLRTIFIFFSHPWDCLNHWILWVWIGKGVFCIEQIWGALKAAPSFAWHWRPLPICRWETNERMHLQLESEFPVWIVERDTVAFAFLLELYCVLLIKVKRSMMIFQLSNRSSSSRSGISYAVSLSIGKGSGQSISWIHITYMKSWLWNRPISVIKIQYKITSILYILSIFQIILEYFVPCWRSLFSFWYIYILKLPWTSVFCCMVEFQGEKNGSVWSVWSVWPIALYHYTARIRKTYGSQPKWPYVIPNLSMVYDVFFPLSVGHTGKPQCFKRFRTEPQAHWEAVAQKMHHPSDFE